MQRIKLEGFLVDVHNPSESTLEVEIDCSHIGWEEYRKLVIELEDLLSRIDEDHSVRSQLVRGRGLRARYQRVTADRRTRKLQFSPLPSTYRNVLTNTRAHVYNNLVSQHCLVLEAIGPRKTYLLPKMIAPGFIEAIDSLNRGNLEPLRKDIEEFRNSNDYFMIEQCLHRHGVDPTVLKTAPFTIGNFVVDVLPVDFGYSVEANGKLERQQSIKGVELLRKQIERKYREYSISATKNIIERLIDMAEEFDKIRRVRYFKGRLDKLIELCIALDLNDLVENFLKPVRKICDAPKSDRLKLLEDRFGTASLKGAADAFLEE